nr:MAG TPA: hypothetical protein [Caudoviricetes sp.]
MSDSIAIAVRDDEDIIFKWRRGDDEEETLLFFDEQGDPMDFTDFRFDCDIAPNGRGERIRLSTTTGEITVNQNEVTLTISHDKTEGVNWAVAEWDLQRTNVQGLVKTLCGGKVLLKKDVTRA